MSELDRKRCQFMRCTYHDISGIFREFHYKKDAMGGGISVCFAMLIDHQLQGGAVLGKPRHEHKYPNCVDIRRMACHDNAPKNSESWFLSQVIRWIASNTDHAHVLSYSDTTVGHYGTIYKAANFRQIGTTDATQFVEWNGRTYHPRSISIDRPYSYQLREALKSGEAVLHTGLPKIVWLYTISKKLKRKRKEAPVYSKYQPNQMHLFP